MKKYRVISPHLKDFDYGDILEHVHNTEQYTKKNYRLGGPAFLKSTVETSPDFFELIEVEFTDREFQIKTKDFLDLYEFFKMTQDRSRLIKPLEVYIKYLQEFQKNLK